MEDKIRILNKLAKLKRCHEKTDKWLYWEMCGKVQLEYFLTTQTKCSKFFNFCRNHHLSQIESISVSIVITFFLMFHFGGGLTTV